MSKKQNTWSTMHMEGLHVVPHSMFINLDGLAEIVIKINGKDHKVDINKLEKLLEDTLC